MRCTQLLVVAVALAACGKSEKSKPADNAPPAPAPAGSAAPAPAADPSPTPTAAAAPKKACMFVTAEDASTILESKVKYVEDEDEGCALVSTNEPPSGDQVNWAVLEGPNDMFAQAKPIDVAGGQLKLDGDVKTGPITFAYTKGGKTVFGTLVMVGAPRPDADKRLTALITKIAEKL